MSFGYSPCVNPAAALAWENRWEAEFRCQWRGLAKSWGGSSLYEPVTPREPIVIPANESVRTILELERIINGGLMPARGERK